MRIPVPAAARDVSVPWLARAAAAVFLVLAVAQGVYYAPIISGDALIHVTIMERSAHGDWFAFNAGAPEASSSSPLWTIIGAALVRLGGLAFGIVAIKTLSVAAWVSIGVLVRALAIRLGSRRDLALCGGALAIAMPGTVMNGVEGMENGAFAALVLGTLLAALSPRTRRTTFGVFALAGLAAALRPEGVVVVLAALAARARDLRRDGPIALAALASTAAPCLVWFALTTEHFVPTSGVSRVMAARRDALSLHAGAIWIYLAPLARLVAYGPISVAAAIGWRRSRLLGATTIAGTALYALVTGAVHTSRYLIWIFALVIALACAEASTRTVRAIAPGLAWLLAVCLGDAYVRVAVLGLWGPRISEIARAPAARKDTTDALLVGILSGGCHPAVPAVALIEVQERFFLDDRVRVLSLDGVTNGARGRPASYDPEGYPRIEDLLDDPDVVALVSNPDSLVGRHPDLRVAALARGWGRAEVPGWLWAPTGLVRVCPEP